MNDKSKIDDFSIVQADDKVFLFLPAQEKDCKEAQLYYNKKNLMLLQRDNIVLILKDIPLSARSLLAEQKQITITEIAADNKTIIRGYEVEMIINTNIPNDDKLSENFDKDFSFMQNILSEEEYQKFKKTAGF